MSEDALPPSLQESILAALVFDESYGALIATQITPRYFDDSYRDIAERILGYRRRYGRPPGRAHLDDMFGKALEGNRAPRLRRILFGLSALAEGLNAEYVAHRTQEFMRRQTLKGAIIQASALYQQGGTEPALEDVEGILYKALRSRTESFEAGTFLDDTSKSLRFLEQAQTGWMLGIEELDRLNISLVPKELLLYIAPKGTGKTWFSVHCGKQALLQGARVCHISLEFREELTVGRYYQALFAGSRGGEKFNRSTLEFDSLDRLNGWKTRQATPRLDFNSPSGRRALRKRLKAWGLKLGRLVVKDFPSGRLTVSQLESYLDYLELTHKFIPQVLIIDYPDLMQIDRKNLRIDIGRTVVDLRGLAAERNCALVCPTQSNRSSLTARRVGSEMVAEDVTKINTADNVLAYSQTKAEALRGLARISVEHARNAMKGSTILITQSYQTGQYVIDSARMTPMYWDKLKAVTTDDEEETS